MAEDFRIEPGDDTQQRALARPVEAQHADLRALEKRQGDLAQDLLVGGPVAFAHAQHRKDDFVVAHKKPRLDDRKDRGSRWTLK